MSWGSTFRSAWSKASKSAQEAAEKAAKTAKSAAEYIEKKTYEGIDYGKQKYHEAKEASSKAYGEAKEFSKKKYEQGKTYSKEKYEEGRQLAEESYDTGKEVAAGAYKEGKAIGRAVAYSPLNLYDAIDSGTKFGTTQAGLPSQPCAKQASPPTDTKQEPNDKSPADTSPTHICKVRKLTLICEHGRTVGKEGILMVVPSSVGSRGDDITMNIGFEGGCGGTHPQWQVGGLWNTTGSSSKHKFSAQSIRSVSLNPFRAKYREPVAYAVSANACQGGRTYEVRAYPGTKDSFEFDGRTVLDPIMRWLEWLPMEKEKTKNYGWEILQGKLSFEGKWVEDSASWQAYYESKWTGGFDPIIGGKGEFPVYPMTSMPRIVRKYLKAGVFLEVSAGLKITGASESQYWPHDQRTVVLGIAWEGGGQFGLQISVQLKLAHSDVVEAAVYGSTGLEATIKSNPSAADLEFDLEAKWKGLEAGVTIKALWGFVSYKRSWQVIDEHEFGKHKWIPGK